MKLVEYKRFKKEFRNCFTSFANSTVELENGVTYSLKEIDGTIFVELGKEMVNKEEKINTINRYENKKLLKNCEYNFGGINYTITGIGPDAIKAIKGDEPEERYFRYRSSLEAEYLLEKLVTIVGQMTLI